MVDREARDRMAAAVQDYLDDKITAFAFDDRLDEANANTQDKTVKSVRLAFWGHYDDVKNHRLVASKEEWNYFYRLLLLLKSDGEIASTSSRQRWGWSNTIAALALVVFAVLAWRVGFNSQLLLLAIPFGIISMLLSRRTRRQLRQSTSEEIALMPFPSLVSLLRLRRTVPLFAKTPYPGALAHRKVRSPWAERLMNIYAGILWLLFAPVPLFFQMLPEREVKFDILAPTRDAAAT